MTDQTKAPERIWAKNFPMRRRGTYAEGEFHSRWEERSSAETEYIRADFAAEQVKSAYERGLDDAARVAEVKPRKGGRPLSGPHHAGIRRGRAEAARLIRALKSNDPNGRPQ